MYREYGALREKCDLLPDEPTYQDLLPIKAEWDKLTLKLFQRFDISEITDMWTRLDSEICDSDYFDNFVSYLYYASDRMNLNRWCRLQLLLGNALSKAYEENEYYNNK